MDKRVDKGEDFKKSGMTLITEVDSERHLKRAAKEKAKVDPRNDEDYDTWEYGTEPLPGDLEWADGFVGK